MSGSSSPADASGEFGSRSTLISGSILYRSVRNNSKDSSSKDNANNTSSTLQRASATNDEDAATRSAAAAAAATAAAAAAAAASVGPYYRISTDGDEDEANNEDYVKCAALLARLLRARQAYKSVRHGGADAACAYTVEQLDALAQQSTYDGADDNVAAAEDSSSSRSNNNSTATAATALAPLRLTYEGGVYRFTGMQTHLPSWATFVRDVNAAYDAIESGPCLSTARMRLTVLAEKFRLYALVNHERECASDAYLRGGGVYGPCTKVDNAVHLRTAAVAPALLELLVTTASEAPHTPLFTELTPCNSSGNTTTAKDDGSSSGGSGDDRPCEAGGDATRTTVRAIAAPAAVRGSRVGVVARDVSVAEYLARGGVHDAREMTVEGLGLHPTVYRNKFLPYDMLSEQSNPAGVFAARLLQALLSTRGPAHGDLCGALLRGALERQELSCRRPTVATAMLLDVYGRDVDEVAQLAAWVARQGYDAAFTRHVWTLALTRRPPPPLLYTGTVTTMAADGDGHEQQQQQRQQQQQQQQRRLHGDSLGSNTDNITVAEQLRNVFYPLFMATLQPRSPRWAAVAQLLQHTGAISVQTESTVRKANVSSTPIDPATVLLYGSVNSNNSHGGGSSSNMSGSTTTAAAASAGATAAVRHECSDYYYMYHVWANVVTLNALRARCGLNTLHFHLEVQEPASAYDQLICGFLLARVVYHASSLAKSWVMQFLYLCGRVGVVLAPLRDNSLGTPYLEHAVVRYFEQGMRVSLTTADPLHYHHRRDAPLLEEYATLCKLRSLGAMDVAELARNSVLNSGFALATKRQWLGEGYGRRRHNPDSVLAAAVDDNDDDDDDDGDVGASNDMLCSCVCNYRLQFRRECLVHEEVLLNVMVAKAAAAAAAAAKGGNTAATDAASLPPMVRITSVPLALAQEQRIRDATATLAAAAGDASGAVAVCGDAHKDTNNNNSNSTAAAQQRRRRQRGDRNVDRSVRFTRVVVTPDTSYVDEHHHNQQQQQQQQQHLLQQQQHGDASDHTTATAAAVVTGGAREAAMLRRVLLLRSKYTNFRIVDVHVEDVFSAANHLDEDVWEYNSYYGVVLLSRVGKQPQWPAYIPSVQQFIHDMAVVRRAIRNRALRRLCTHRLRLLERRFVLHRSLNIASEAGARATKRYNNRDFFTAHKVDTNVHTDAGCNARTLLEFFVEKAQGHGDDVVGVESGSTRPVTLRALLQRYAIDAAHITVDELHHQLQTHPDLHDIFLSTQNAMQGRYFAELTKRTLRMYEEDAYSFAENRLTLHGRSAHEWVALAHWFDRYGMASAQNRWMVCVPLQYRRLRREGCVRDWGEWLDNLFRPLWEISLHPASDTKFHYFLAHVSGFDCYGDETKLDLPLTCTYPHDWRSELNPPYNLYLYYLWANIVALNEFRAARGLGTFAFRPSCGEVGAVDHLVGGLLLASGISHGVTLAKNAVLEYLYYLTQLGIAMSPLSNTAHASTYLDNPFPTFFRRGLNVSLATNTPLYFHFTREPLLEEYSLAAKLWQLEFNDLAEIARNSVAQSGFPPAWKARALGPLHHLRSTLGNDVRQSRVSDVRVAYRFETYHGELDMLDAHLLSSRQRRCGQHARVQEPQHQQQHRRRQQRMPRALRTLREEAQAYNLAAFTLQLPPRQLSLTHGNDDESTSDDDDGDDVMTAEQRRQRRQRRNECVDSDAATSATTTTRTLAELQSETAQLERALLRAQLLARQLSDDNVELARMVNTTRTRLEAHGLAILGGLTPYRGRQDEDADEDADEDDDAHTPLRDAAAATASHDKPSNNDNDNDDKYSNDDDSDSNSRRRGSSDDDDDDDDSFDKDDGDDRVTRMTSRRQPTRPPTAKMTRHGVMPATPHTPHLDQNDNNGGDDDGANDDDDEGGEHVSASHK